MNPPGAPPPERPPYGGGPPPAHGPGTYDYAGAPGGPAPDAPTRPEGLAGTSLALGLTSIVCLGPIVGVPAVVLGFLARGRIARSGGTLSGGGVALAGIVTGALGTLWTMLWMMLSLSGILAGVMAPSSASRGSTPAPVVAAPAVVDEHAVTIVDLRPGAPLRGQLGAESALASAAKQTLLVQTTATWCKPCKEIAAALGEDELATALTDVRLVRVDVDAFDGELAELGLKAQSVPWFFLFDAKLTKTDAISGDEWDENEASNIGPVLGAFVKGTLTRRRHRR